MLSSDEEVVASDQVRLDEPSRRVAALAHVRLEHDADTPARVASPDAELDVLPVREQVLVETADLRDAPAPEEHQGPRDPLDPDHALGELSVW